MTPPVGPAKTPLSDKAISALRTLVFGAWMLALGWLLTKFAIPEVFRIQIDALGQAGTTWVLMSVLYPLLRKIEAKLPPWLTRILLGSNQAPTYIDQAGRILPPGPRFMGTAATFTSSSSVTPDAVAKEVRRRRGGGLN